MKTPNRSFRLRSWWFKQLALPCQALSRLVLTRWVYGKEGLRRLFSRVRIWRGGKRWYLIASLLMPALAACSIGIRSWFDDAFAVVPNAPLGQVVGEIGITGLQLTLPLMFLGLLFSSPLLEEFGWRGFALPKLQGRFSALASGLLLGFVTALWQAPLAVLLAGDSPAPYFLVAIGTSVLMTWIFNSTDGNLLMALLFHASLAVALTVLDPGGEDPVLPILVWLVALFIVLRYGPQDLARQPRFQWCDNGIARPVIEQSDV